MAETRTRLIVLWILLAFMLHLAWEIAHLPLYGLWRDPSAMRIARYVLHCAGGDVLIATSAFLVAAAVFRRVNWVAHAPVRGGAIMIATGLVYTAFSEWFNVYRVGSWSYAESMPLIAGIGLTPLLQWIVVPTVMLIIVRRAVATAGT